VELTRNHLLAALAGLIVGAVLMTVLPAGADDGDYLVLGETNTATTPTKVWARRGVLFRAAKLDTPAATFLVRSGPPIAVDSTDLVENLNADLLDGSEASAFLSRVEVVKNSLADTVPAHGSVSLAATCPTGTVVTGGGGSVPASLVISASLPSASTGDAWHITVANPTDTAEASVFFAYAICASVEWVPCAGC
jgi:hypothetical protein